MEIIKSLPIILGFITALATLWSAAYLTGRFSPNIDLMIKPVWSSDQDKRMKLIIEIENKGFIRVGIEKVLLAIDFLDNTNNKKDEVFLLSGKEWISFDNAEHIMTSSYYINPKEVIHIERLYTIGAHAVIHSGIQVYLKFPWYIQRLGGQVRSTRQTRVYYFSKYLSD